MPQNRRAGFTNISINGTKYDVAGEVTYNLGQPKREFLVGPSGVQGYKELPQVPFCELDIRDSRDLTVTTILNTVDATVTLGLANDKTFLLRDAVYTGEGDITTDEAMISARFEGVSAEEIAP